MSSEKLSPYAHLYLGLTRQELARRMALGQINPQLLNAQLDQNAQEVKLEAMCEKWIQMQSLEQVDKYTASE
ncbi:MAG: hypothetical protein H7328_13770 [Bdellovibrio sp.]|nr:hypothetical protein [Bdellovibrio sp.]